MTSYSFNYPLMKLLCEELEKEVIGFTVDHCLPNDLSRFVLILTKQHQQKRVFFCFKPPFIRFHLQSSTFSPESSSHPLLSFLKGATLTKVDLLQQDRILQLNFKTLQGERLLIAEFFSKHPNYYLIQPDGKILFSLHPLQHSHYQLPPFRSLAQETPSLFSHQEVERAYRQLEKQEEFVKEKQTLSSQLSKQHKKLKRKEEELLAQLKHCAQWPTIQHEGELIKFYFASIKKGSPFVTVHDWENDQPYELKLNPAKNLQEEMASRFKQAKKMQNGLIPLSHYLEHIQVEQKEIEKQQQRVAIIQTAEELNSFKAEMKNFLFKPSQPQKKSSNLPPPIYKEYQSAKGLKIWVGKNAKANDRLTFQLANGRDWWLHAKGYAGSHVIIRLSKDQEPDSDTLQDAMQLALYYSKARSQGEGEICFTQRKYVSRLGKGKAGLVQISKHQTKWIRFDPIRYNALKER